MLDTRLYKHCTVKYILRSESQRPLHFTSPLSKWVFVGHVVYDYRHKTYANSWEQSFLFDIPSSRPTYVTNLILSSHFLLKINIGCHYRLPCLLGEVFFSTGSLRVFVEYIVCDVLSCFTLCRSYILNLFVFMIYMKNVTIQECSVLFVNGR